MNKLQNLYRLLNIDKYYKGYFRLCEQNKISVEKYSHYFKVFLKEYTTNAWLCGIYQTESLINRSIKNKNVHKKYWNLVQKY